MKHITSMDINLTERDVKIIIADTLRDQFPGYNIKPEDVTLSVCMDTVGFYMDEHQVPKFKGAVIHCSISKED